MLKRFSRVIATVVCAGWVSSGLAYTFNPIGDVFWQKPVLSSLPDNWKELIIRSQHMQASTPDSGAGAASNSDGTRCNGGGGCTYPASTRDFSNGVDLTSNGGLGFSGGGHMPPRPGVNQVDHGPVFIPNTVDAPHASGVQQSCDGTALSFSNSRLCPPSSGSDDDPATEPTTDSDGGLPVPSYDDASGGSAGGINPDPADGGNGSLSPGQEQASADVDAPATFALVGLGLVSLSLYRKHLRQSA